MKTIVITQGQTIYDIAIQEYGCYEGVKLLCDDNGLGLVTELVAGDTLLIRNEVPAINDFNISASAYLKSSSMKPNSGYKSDVELFYSHGFYSPKFYV
jgi:hypothetical protein